MVKQKGALFLFFNIMGAAYGGMENHGYYMKKYFTDHLTYPLIAVISKDNNSCNHIFLPNGKLIHSCVTIQFVSKFIITKSVSVRTICFFNSGHWIEDILELRKVLRAAIFIQRTGGNDH